MENIKLTSREKLMSYLVIYLIRFLTTIKNMDDGMARALKDIHHELRCNL